MSSATYRREFTFGTVRSGVVKEADEVLLNRFVTRRDELAFEALILRHGPRVFRICSRWSLCLQDAEDAFQATFLALVVRSPEIRYGGSLGVWVTRVARRIAIRQRLLARRGRVAAPLDLQELADMNTSDDGDDTPLVRAEIARLPEEYRRPVELCFLQGLTNREAALRLNCPSGTLKWRLAKAKEMLRSRLVRLGIVLSLLVFWRRPAQASSPLAPLSGGMAHSVGRLRACAPAPSTALILRTTKLALLTRDWMTTSATTPGSRSRQSDGPRRAVVPGPAVPIAVVAMLMALLLAIPAFSRMIPAWSNWWRPAPTTALANDNPPGVVPLCIQAPSQ